MGRDGGEPGHARLIRVSLDEFGCPVAEHHDRRVRTPAGDDRRMDPSITHRFSTPRTRHRWSTTAFAPQSLPIGALPHRCCDVDHTAGPICVTALNNSRANSLP